jgi:HPt (histidine-containing phosphotransfer) domain-containing protein
MTASALPGDKERCAAAGMKNQLIKPIRRNDLEIVLKSYFLTNEIPAHSSIQWEILKKLAEQTDLLTIQKVVDSFLETLPNALESITSSQANRDLEKIKKSAHRLKSGSSTIGASKLSSICEDLEKTPQNNELIDQLQKEASLLQTDLQSWNRNIS